MDLLNYIFQNYIGHLIFILCVLLLALAMIYIKERRTRPLSPEGPSLAEAPDPLKSSAKLEATEIRDLTPSSAEEEEVSAEEVLHTATHPEEKI